MPIRSRITGHTARLKAKQDAKRLHSLLAPGSKHHAVWHTLVEAGRKGLTAYQLQQREHNYHPQVLSDLAANGLVQKLGKKGQQFIYTADPTGRGVITQRVEVKVELYETGNGQLVTRTIVQGIRGRPDQICKKLAERTISFTIPTRDGKWVTPVSPGEIVVDDKQGHQHPPEPARIGYVIPMDNGWPHGDGGIIIDQ